MTANIHSFFLCKAGFLKPPSSFFSAFWSSSLSFLTVGFLDPTSSFFSSFFFSFLSAPSDFFSPSDFSSFSSTPSDFFSASFFFSFPSFFGEASFFSSPSFLSSPSLSASLSLFLVGPLRPLSPEFLPSFFVLSSPTVSLFLQVALWALVRSALRGISQGAHLLVPF